VLLNVQNKKLFIEIKYSDLLDVNMEEFFAKYFAVKLLVRLY